MSPRDRGVKRRSQIWSVSAVAAVKWQLEQQLLPVGHTEGDKHRAFKLVKVSLNLNSQLEKQQSLTQRGGQEKFEAPQVSKNREKEANTREEVTRLSLSVKK